MPQCGRPLVSRWVFGSITENMIKFSAFAGPNWIVANLCVAALLFPGFVSTAMAVPNMSADEVLADGCSATPPNFGLSDFWNAEMGVLEAGCAYPAITQSDINGRRKPEAYAHGSANKVHDTNAVKVLNGTGESSDTLGMAPRTAVSFGLYCTDPRSVLAEAKVGDVAFSLRAWDADCRLLDLGLNWNLPTIPVYGEDNTDKYVGNSRNHPGIQVSTGWNFGRAIDYFTPGDAAGIIARGNVSDALPQFSGIVAALNAALISQNRAVLSNDALKAVLDASSNEVYLERNGTRGIYNEIVSCVGSCKYYGQMINLSGAISYALNNSPALTLLTVINKVINDDGGNKTVADFDILVDGGIYTGGVARFSGEWLEVTNSVTYNISTDPVPGYALTDVECKDDVTGSSIGGPSLILVPGQSATCTITVDDGAPQITIFKQVKIENGGSLVPSDFILYLSGKGLDASIERKSGEPPITVTANETYRLSEKSVPGYSRTGTVCVDDGTGASLGHPVRPLEGQLISCTISNIDREESSFFVIPLRSGKSVVFGL